MTKKEIKNAVEYWKATAKHDFETMKFLFKGKRHSDSLFFGHIVLEKILKGLVVRNTGGQAPYTHNLILLMSIALPGFAKEYKDLLNDVNDFNIRSRYPEQKLEFYKKCTPIYTKKYYEKIVELYTFLCQKLK